MKGIMFKEDLFKLTIERIKTQTRRTVNVPDDYELINHNDITGYTTFHYNIMDGKAGMIHGMYPRYRKGGTVYLKEPFIIDPPPSKDGCQIVVYKYGNNDSFHRTGWKNKMFMPEKYARYFIKITNVRIQKLNEISEPDAIAEGINEIIHIYPVLAFEALWKKINGKESWSANPYVWAYDYELTEKL